MPKLTSVQVCHLSQLDVDHSDFSLPGEDVPSPPGLSAKAKGKQRAIHSPFDRDPGETMTEYEVRGKEWELVNVLESQKMAKRRLEDGPAAEDRERIDLERLERDRDKDWIRSLEQEVAQL